MVDVLGALSQMLENIVHALPAIIAAVIVVIIGWVVGSLVGKAVNRIVEKIGVEKTFDQSIAGRAFKAAGLDFSDLVGGLVKAFIVVLSIVLAVQILNIPGTFGAYLMNIADYLPRLLGGILIIILGTVFVDFLATFIGRMIRPMFPEAKAEIADMLKNLLFIGLIAFVLLLALDTMLLAGSTVYPLILGFVIISAGICLTDGLIKSITDDHAEFREVAGFAKFVLYSIFMLIGAGAIFATYAHVTQIVANVSWAFAIALAIMLIPIAYTLTRKLSRETKEASS